MSLNLQLTLNIASVQMQSTINFLQRWDLNKKKDKIIKRVKMNNDN